MKTLLLMRHAKSDWAAPYDGDHDRPLNDRGIKSARLIGRVLAGRGEIPDHIISSTATRARTTAELASEAGGWAAEIVLDRALYASGPAGVIEVASRAPDISRLMLVGHQPTWSLVVSQLTGVTAEMKTAAVAIIDLDIAEWLSLPESTGVLTDVIYPRDHVGSEHDS